MAIPTTGLLAEYLGSISGGQLLDSSGNSRHATLSGSGTTEDTTHPLGIGVQFDGNGYATMPSGAYPTGVSNWTIALWFYQPTRASSWEAMLEIGRFAHQERIGCLLQGNTWDIVLTDDDDKAYHNVGDYTGNWHFLVWKWDGTTTTCYYDSATPSETYTIHNFDIYDGGVIGASFGGSNRYSGKMARIRIYDRALDNNDIYALYTESLAAISVCGMPHALLLSKSLALPHALQSTGFVCSLPHGLARIDSSLLLPHALRDRLSQTCSMPHGLQTNAASSAALPHALALRSAAGASLSLPHAAYDPAADQAPQVRFLVAGRNVELESLVLTADEDAFAIRAELTLAFLEDWLRIAPGDACRLLVDAMELDLLADEHIRTREFGTQKLTLLASSPASRLAAPHADIVTRSWEHAAAHDIAQDLCSLADLDPPLVLDWQICNWTLERFDVEAQTPIQALATLVTQAACLVSATDGSLVAQYRYPQSPASYARETPDISFCDYEDITWLEQESVLRPCYDAVDLFSEAPVSNAVQILQQWQGADGNENLRLPRNQRMVAAFVWPEQDLQLVATGCDCTVYEQGRLEFEHEELVEFADGQASASYPVLQLLEWNWRCQELGTVTASATTLHSEQTTPGCSLCRVRYSSACRLFLVESRNLEDVQVHTLLQGEAQQATSTAGLLLTVQRGKGQRPSPESIVDPLCRSLAILRERGRNYLDEHGYMKELYDITTSPRPLVTPGALAAVQDGSLREQWRAKVRGWELRGPAANMRVRWQLERSLT